LMEELSEQQREILLFVHQSQHEESLQHRRSILNAFSLSVTGLMAIMAGAIAIGHMSVNLKNGVVIAIVVVWVSVIAFIRQERQKSEEAMEILRSIEEPLK